MKFKKYGFLISILFISFYLINTKELFEDYYQKAEAILSTMSRNEKIGQMFLSRYSLETVDDDIKQYSPAGFVLFADNLYHHTEKQLIKELNERRKISKIPLVFGVDEEGGIVCQASIIFRKEKFPSPRESYLKGGIKEILKIEKEKILLLKKLNININFGPVADISLDPNDYIYPRTLGENVSTTSDYINDVVDSYNNAHFTCCLKHFPGYGNNINTHDDVSHDERPIEYLMNNDFVPFARAISHNVPMIMVSHNIIVNIDNEYPSSLSKKIHNLLRNEYGFKGLIVTDSLAMGAIIKYTKDISPAVLAVLAGNDLIITFNLKEHIEEVIKAVENNQIDMSLIEKAAKRVIAWKLKYIYEYGIFDKNNINKLLYVSIGILTIGIIIIVVIICYINNKKKKKKKTKKKKKKKKNLNILIEGNEKKYLTNKGRLIKAKFEQND